MGGPDWLYFTLAGILGVLSLWLFYRGLFADRSRGRKRCPKCFYDLSAAKNNTCPECGRVVRKPRQLHKTRRYKGRTALALLCLPLAGSAVLVPHLRVVGWPRYLPNTALIWLLPTVDSDTDALWVELYRRWEAPILAAQSRGETVESDPYLRGELSPTQRRQLAGSCGAIIHEDRSVALVESALAILLLLEADAEPAVESLVEGIRAGSFAYRVELMAMSVLQAIGPGAAPAVPVLLQLLEQVGPPDKWSNESWGLKTNALTAVVTLGKIGPAAADAVPKLREGLQAQEAIVVGCCASALGAIGPAATEALPDLLPIARQHHRSSAYWAIEAIARIEPDSVEVRQTLVDAAASDHHIAQRAAIRSLSAQPDLLIETTARLRELLHSEDEASRMTAVAGLRQLPPPHRISVDELNQLVQGDQATSVRGEAAKTLAQLAQGGDAVAVVALDEVLAKSDAATQRLIRLAGWKRREEHTGSTSTDPTDAP